MNDWLRVTTIGGGDYECRMTILKTDDTTITVTRPWHHHWTDGWDWKTIIRQWLSDVPETFEPYDGLAEWLRDADAERDPRGSRRQQGRPVQGRRQGVETSRKGLDVKDFSAWANAWSDYSRSDVNYLVFVVGGTAALVVLALSLLLESNGTVLTFFCGLAVIVTLAGIWVVNFYPIWMEDSPEPAVFTTQVEKEFGVHDFSCPPDVMSVKDGLPDAGTYRCTVSDGRDDSALKDVTVIVTADNKVGLYDNQGKVLK